MSTRGTVYVVDDDVSFRTTAQAVLENAGYRVLAFDQAAAIAAQQPPSEPACLVLDLRLRQESGLAVQSRLAEDGWRQPVIFVSGSGTVASAASAMRAGAIDFLEKPVRREDLLARVAQALKIDTERRQHELELHPLIERYRKLTQREREVAERIERGLSSKQIAHELSSSVRTVEHHRSRILRKMESANSAELSRALTLVRMHGHAAGGGESQTAPSLTP
jgi:FixJ family two-component response regulator